MNTPSVSCIILAGGEGKRFHHADKGLVEFDGQPLIAHVMAALKHQVDDVVISANRNFERYRAFSPSVVPDVNEKHGPLSGIVAALPICRHEQVLVVPCDMPFLPDDLLARLLAGYAQHDISIVEVQGRLQLVLLMRKSRLASVQDRLVAGDYRLMQWVKACSPAIVHFDDRAAAFKNINDAHELDGL
ncbi:MAG: molybdenum cofactor guanylyltransferase [Gammaproteobacteria bacterium]|jgi:molybdopterin-guanine dinucleotide biosynthesis protein A|nr:molybdenum cofactor guanylyltransferase [Gammaproteobacteria bacterium]